jgi:hypothetical protein
VRDDWANGGGASRVGQVLFGTGITLGTAVFSNGTPPPTLRSLVERIDAAVYFVHARDVPVERRPNEGFHELARGRKGIWEAPGGHMDAIEASPAEYERRIVAFLDAALLEP